MSGLYTEADYENSIIELFQNIGYRYVYGPDVERDFCSPLYEEELTAALHRLNPTMPEEAIADALFKLKNFENAELVQKNAVFTDYIQHGVEVRYFAGGEECSGLVYLVDYKNPDNNSFIVANQWTFIENSNKRPDVLLLFEWPSCRSGGTQIPVQRRDRRIRGIRADQKLYARNPLHVHLQLHLRHERPSDLQGRHYYIRRRPFYGMENQGRQL